MIATGVRSSCDASAMSRRCSSNEPIESPEQVVEHRGQTAELIARVRYGDALVQRRRADPRRLLGDRGYGLEALPREQAAAGRCHEQHQRNTRCPSA